MLRPCLCCACPPGNGAALPETFWLPPIYEEDTSCWLLRLLKALGEPSCWAAAAAPKGSSGGAQAVKGTPYHASLVESASRRGSFEAGMEVLRDMPSFPDAGPGAARN
jgi:hypothetical protein